MNAIGRALRRRRIFVVPLMMASVACCLGAPLVQGDESSPRLAPATTTEEPPGLDSRARRLVSALGLTDAQQAELAKILASRRELVRRLWTEQTIAPEYRVSAMQVINDKTEERIRALLNDEQKKKYLASRPTQSNGSSQQSALDHWLNGSKSN
jgi:hypothetical protein